MAVYNTTMAIKNLGLEPIFQVMKMIGTKNRIEVVASSIKLAAKFKEKREMEKEQNGR